MFRSSLPPVVLQEGSCLIYVISVCLVRLYLQLFCRRAHVLFTLLVFVWFVFTSSCLQEGSCLIYVISVYLLYRVVQHILCCVFVLFFFVLCQFLWIVHFWLLLRYSPTFIVNPAMWKNEWCPLWRPCLYCFRFLSSLYMNQVPEKPLVYLV